MGRVVFVVAGGEFGDPAFFRQEAERVRPAALICADGGARHLMDAGIVPDLIVGDLDSLGEPARRFCEAQGCRIERHPRHKDQTDTELALAEAFALEPEEVWIWGALGHRVDHTLANLALLIQGRRKGIGVRLVDAWCELFLIQGRAEIAGRPGQTVSLFPFGGPASGVTLRGFEYPLTRADLDPGRPVGVSNRLAAERAVVEVERGFLVAVRYFRPGGFPGEVKG
jgi:thiamine pyrophosphokinase